MLLYIRGRIQSRVKKYNRPVGYYSTFKNALKALVDAEIKGTGLKGFKIVVNKIDELHKLIESMSPIQKGDKQ